MPKVEVANSRAQFMLCVVKITAKHTQLKLARGREIHFWSGTPVAVTAGEAVWYRSNPQPAVTKMIASIEPLDAPRIQCSAEEFDYSIGQALTLTGLPLTRLQKD